MGKPKFSGIGVVDLQNSVGNITFSRNAYGTYSKTRIGAPASTPFLVNWQNIYSSLYFDWLTIMNDNERKAWYRFYIPGRNNMAMGYLYNGFNAYIYVNMNRAILAQIPIYTPPSTYNAPPIPAQPFFSSLTFLNIAVDIPVANAYNTVIYLSKPLPASRMSLNQILALTANIDPGLTTQGMWANWAVRYTTIAPGQKVFGKAFCINIANGCRSAAKYFVGIAT